MNNTSKGPLKSADFTDKEIIDMLAKIFGVGVKVPDAVVADAAKKEA